ncbi:4'-phosphopantetheinyl transferase family protein [Propioniciclava tarda]|uniref:4'-phosphopantetheinyl transferase family protein n=1 Tax=Propioniciclava tarda TaxID=433330 RepID=UPI00116F13A0|nr:4'-phosphopantetheinyl transferase superfamily protein [Propioniciclava tarda]SMO33408.1 4'-phosphopantetheinyl transferase [Propioniciclava tarda]
MFELNGVAQRGYEGLPFRLGVSQGPEVGPGSPWPWPSGVPTDLKIGHEPQGRPLFVDRPDLHLSLSHTAGAVAVAVGDRPLGVDVERVGRHDPRIVARLFSAREQAYLDADPTLTEQRFAELWTRKEAHAKRSGAGGRELVRGIDVLDADATVTLLVDGFALSVCY